MLKCCEHINFTISSGSLYLPVVKCNVFKEMLYGYSKIITPRFSFDRADEHVHGSYQVPILLFTSRENTVDSECDTTAKSYHR